MYHENIIFTDRENIEDINVVTNTMNISQVSGDIHKETNDPHKPWKLTTSLIPCLCLS